MRSQELGQLKTQETHLHPILRQALPHNCVLLSQTSSSKDRCYSVVDYFNGAEAQDFAKPRLSVGGQGTILAMKLAFCHIGGGVPLTSPHRPDGAWQQQNAIV